MESIDEKWGYLHHSDSNLWSFWIQSGNHEKRFWQASSGRKTQPRRRKHRSELKNSAKFRQRFSQVCSIFKNSLFFIIFCNCSPYCCPRVANFDLNKFPNFSNFHGNNQHLLDYHVSSDFVTNIIEFSQNCFETLQRKENNV